MGLILKKAAYSVGSESAIDNYLREIRGRRELDSKEIEGLCDIRDSGRKSTVRLLMLLTF